jgi:hypothetical protein
MYAAQVPGHNPLSRMQLVQQLQQQQQQQLLSVMLVPMVRLLGSKQRLNMRLR